MCSINNAGTVHSLIRNWCALERHSRRERAAISCDSERKSAGSPAISILSNARKSVENNGVFSLSFRSFLSLFFAIKEKEKDI